MRYTNGIAVIIPWMDSEGDRNHSRFTFKGNVDKRRVRREIRSRLRAIGIHAPKSTLNFYIAQRSYELGTAT